MKLKGSDGTSELVIGDWRLEMEMELELEWEWMIGVGEGDVSDISG